METVVPKEPNLWRIHKVKLALVVFFFCCAKAFWSHWIESSQEYGSPVKVLRAAINLQIGSSLGVGIEGTEYILAKDRPSVHRYLSERGWVFKEQMGDGDVFHQANLKLRGSMVHCTRWFVVWLPQPLYEISEGEASGL